MISKKDLREFLARFGLSHPKTLQRHLGISQPMFSRLAKSMGEELLVVGRARATRYALWRSIRHTGSSIPVFEIAEDGNCREVAILHAILPKGFFVESLVKSMPQESFDDLPYFLDGLRPAGFLGRLIPGQHPDLELPTDIRNWSAEHCLRYLTRWGWNLSGNFIVGREARDLWRSNMDGPPDLVDSAKRETQYQLKAREVIMQGTPGSSAAGEQPKFLATRSPDLKPIMVKFALDTQTDSGLRRADLLVGEHLAHQTLSDHGQEACESHLFRGNGGELFLELERFDRVGPRGRLGLITLQALDSQFLGRLQSWGDSAQALAELGKIPEDAVRNIRWLHLFGQLIGNTDMHHGNVSFITRGTRTVKLAPVYDMLPMLYAPRDQHPSEQDGVATIGPGPGVEFTSTLAQDSNVEYHYTSRAVPDLGLPTREAQNADIWNSAIGAAIDYWQRLSSHPLASDEFQSIAQGNRVKIDSI